MRTSTPTTYSEIEGTVVRETDKAWMIQVANNKALEGQKMWWPKSQATKVTSNIPGCSEKFKKFRFPDWLINTKVNEALAEMGKPEPAPQFDDAAEKFTATDGEDDDFPF